MKKKLDPTLSKKSLTLSRETLATLTHPDLVTVVGGLRATFADCGMSKFWTGC